ncbi:hypothetical protein [Paenibacillus sp. YN15]|uniref:hypothetical protein n=1 Tax=Paenibacillus sp. YN15 TaxID=1742774 RepID=UPI000DCF2C37|nr:hypothetical protein [Paenibacillus sp. YN15]RAU92461.1 hypothetical protein DQG13_27400 [Paenibacillus sp. YN15]
MSDKQKDQLQLEQSRLVDAWRRVLPTTMKTTDTVTVKADEANPKALRVAVGNAGHSRYTFDFLVTYVDSREVKVELVDAEKGEGGTIDERGNLVQDLIQDHVRNLHECAQALQQETHA